MKRIQIPIFFLVLAFTFSACEVNKPLPNPPAGHFTFGDQGDQFASGIVELPNNEGFLMVGGSRAEDSQSYDLMYIKTDASGNEIFTKTFGDETLTEIGWKVIRNSSGEYVIFGTKGDAENSQTQTVQITFLDANLNLIKQVETGDILPSGQFSLRSAQIFEMNGGGYFASISYNEAPILLALNSDGNVYQYSYFQNLLVPNFGEFLMKRPDGSFLVVTQLNNEYFNSSEMLLLEFSNIGFSINQRQIPLSSTGNIFYAAKTMQDSSYQILSFSRSVFSSFLFELDKNLNLVRETDLGQIDNYGMIRETAQHRIIMAGFDNLDYYQFSNPGENLIRLKYMGSDHREISEKAFGGDGIDQVYDMILLSDGRFACVGQTTSFGAGGSDAYLLFFNEGF